MYRSLASEGLNCFPICFSCFVQHCLLFSPLCSTACKCNGHASVCNTNTGKCFCTTKGIKGDECQLWVPFTLLAEIERPRTYWRGTPYIFLMTVFMMSLLISSCWQLTNFIDCAASRASPGGRTWTKWFPKGFYFENISTVMQDGWGEK